jgi:hypothetical protein
MKSRGIRERFSEYTLEFSGGPQDGRRIAGKLAIRPVKFAIQSCYCKGDAKLTCGHSVHMYTADQSRNSLVVLSYRGLVDPGDISHLKDGDAIDVRLKEDGTGDVIENDMS